MQIPLAGLEVEIRSGGDSEQASIEVSLLRGANATNTSSFFAPEHRAQEVFLLALLPGVLCCCMAALAVGLGRWFRARAAACSADGGVLALSRDSKISDSSEDGVARSVVDAGYGGDGGLRGPRFAWVGPGLEVSSDGSTVTDVGTDNRWRTAVWSEPMVDGVHECTYQLLRSQRGLILLGVVRPGFDPCSEDSSDAHETADAWTYCTCRS